MRNREIDPAQIRQEASRTLQTLRDQLLRLENNLLWGEERLSCLNETAGRLAAVIRSSRRSGQRCNATGSCANT